MIRDRIADHNQGTDANARRHEHKEELKADARPLGRFRAPTPTKIPPPSAPIEPSPPIALEDRLPCGVVLASSTFPGESPKRVGQVVTA
jgi:hypothetical protein